VFLFITLLWQAAIADASPIMAIDGNLAKVNNHVSHKGTNKNHLRPSKRIKTILDDRLKRFRMLDPDEFQEMLNSFSHQIPDQQLKEFNSMDTIGGMQLENYWSRK
jgi:hypothetical protein